MTKICLSQKKFCHDKHIFFATKDAFCRDKHVFVATKMILVAATANDTHRSSNKSRRQVRQPEGDVHRHV